MATERGPEFQSSSEIKHNLRQAHWLVLSDTLPNHPVDALFFHGRSHGDDTPILAHAAQLLHSNQVRHLILPGYDGERVGTKELTPKTKYLANCGKAEWARRLDEMGVDIAEQVFFTDQDCLHTRSESAAFQRVLENNLDWKSAAVIAHPHQLVRIMLGTIDELNKRDKIDLTIYAVQPPSTNWNQIVRGSQGQENKPRWHHVSDELRRIPLYQEKGDIASFTQLLEYYRTRDGSLAPLLQSARSQWSGNSHFRQNLQLIYSEIANLPPLQ